MWIVYPCGGMVTLTDISDMAFDCILTLMIIILSHMELNKFTGFKLLKTKTLKKEKEQGRASFETTILLVSQLAEVVIVLNV